MCKGKLFVGQGRDFEKKIAVALDFMKVCFHLHVILGIMAQRTLCQGLLLVYFRVGSP